MNLFRSFVVSCQKISAILVIGLMLMVVNPASAGATPPDFTDGSTLFELYCAGCHPQGGNIIRRRKTLRLKSLARDGYNTSESLSNIVAVGLKNMPGFEEKLNSSQIKSISQFVLDESQRGWQKG